MTSSWRYWLQASLSPSILVVQMSHDWLRLLRNMTSSIFLKRNIWKKKCEISVKNTFTLKMKWKESLQSRSWLVIFLKGLIQIPASLRPLVVKIITSGWGLSDHHIGQSERRWNPGKRILSTVDREKLKPSAAVCLHKHSHSLVDVLPPESDSSIQDLVGTIFDKSFFSVDLSFRYLVA